MNQFIVKTFVKNSENIQDPAVREAYGKTAGTVGIISNLILCAVKILAGIIFGSIAVLADGINNLSDASASLITLIGFKLSGKAPDRDHPYGHGRTEYLTGLIVSVMVICIGAGLFKSSLEKTIHPEPLEFSWLTVAILILAIAVKLWQAGFNTFVGRRIDSDALKATAADSRNDVISTSSVLAAVIIGKLFDINLDGPVGIVVALFILWSGIGLVKEALGPILGQAPDPEMVADLKNTLVSEPKILDIHDLIVHDYGPGRLFASAHAEVDSRENVMEIHDMIDNVEREVYEKHHILMTIHMDPVDLDDPLTAVVNEQIKEITSDMSFILGYHDVRVVTGPTHDNVVFDVVIEHRCKYSEAQIRQMLSDELKKCSDRYNAVITIDKQYA